MSFQKRWLVGILVLLPLLISSAGCSGENNEDNSEPTVNWVADGVISSGEYVSSKGFGPNYELYWRSDTQFVYFAIKAQTNGWVAVAFQPDISLKKLDADMVLGYVSNSQTTIYDLHATGIYGPHPQDTELGGTDNILEYAGSETGGFTIIEFKRALATGDMHDQNITSGTNDILWAYGTEDDVFTGHRAEEEGQPEGGAGYGKITI